MSENYFVRNLETGRLELHFDRVAYQALPAEQKAEIKRVCLFARSLSAWVSRATRSHWQAEDLARRLGLEDRGEKGERLSFEEKVQAKQERAEARAERMEDRADRAQGEWESRHRAADAIASFIPFGQPILIGHHSERRHRRDLEKIQNHEAKAFEAIEKAKHYERRAEVARATAEGKQYSNPAFLGRRIKEAEAEERDLRRRLGGHGRLDPSKPLSDEYTARLQVHLDEVLDRLGFYRHCLETCGVRTFNRESLKVMKEVFIRGRWEAIVRLNPTTVAVPNICYSDPAWQRQCALKYLYCEVKDAR